MNVIETDTPIKELISGVVRKCVTELTYTALPSVDVNVKIRYFYDFYGRYPTFEQIKQFNDRHRGVNCALYADAACDLLRSEGITADRFNLLDPSSSNGAADNHAIVRAADRYWLEPQTGQIFPADDWESFAAEYANLLGVDKRRIVAYCSRSEEMIVGSGWGVLE